MTRDELTTSPTLLGRLREGPSDQVWTEFVDRYAPTVFSWSVRTGLQDSDAADVTQEVLLKLLAQMQSFEYQPSRGTFRAWLKTVTVNAAKDCGRKIMRRPTGDAGLSAISDPKAWNDLAERMEDEYQRDLLEQASELVRARVRQNTWDAYFLTAVENVTAAEAAKRLGMKISEVYVSKSRIIKRLRDAVAELERIDSGVR